MIKPNPTESGRFGRARPGLGLMLLALIMMLVSGCGYHLRGMTSLDPVYQRVYIQGLSQGDPVYRTLAQLFENTHSQLVNDPGRATAVLVIDRNHVDRRVSVVDTQANVRQYELDQQLTYHVRLPDGRTTAPRTIRQARNYNYDPTGVLASSSNESQIRQELAETVGRLLFYGMRAPVRAKQPAKDGTRSGAGTP